MAATSKHYGDVYRWIESIIDSCTQPMHENAASKLITQFHNSLRRDGKVSDDIVYEMEYSLRYRLENKICARWDKVLTKEQ
jgi:hypothetical protein